MLSHKKLWSAIDKLAGDEGMTPSGLAKKAGLDPTSFNKSKRIGSAGKLRWPSTESIYKILKVVEKDLSYFSSIVEPNSFCEIPMIGSLQSQINQLAENHEENEWEKIAFPRSFSKNTIAIKVKGYSLEPIYRNGNTLIIDKKSDDIFKKDRIVIKTKDNEILIREFIERKEKFIKVSALNSDKEIIKISLKDIDWVGKIMWVSQ